MTARQWLRLFSILTLVGAGILALGTVRPAHAAPLPQEGDEATLHVVNESEATICYVLICYPGAENLEEDCPLVAET
jgi:hypothetical protein